MLFVSLIQEDIVFFISQLFQLFTIAIETEEYEVIDPVLFFPIDLFDLLQQMIVYVHVHRVDGEFTLAEYHIKSDAVVKYTLPEDNNHIFASKYFTYLPTEEEFKKELNLDDYEKLN